MSNIAGKAYAMNLVTPIHRQLVRLHELIFWLLDKPPFDRRLRGLLTLSLIHYARWVIVRADDFPRLSSTQPREQLRYGYTLFFSNFNGSWEQYVDSFAAAIPSGLDLLWLLNVRWPGAVPEQPFHRYVQHNQIWTDYYFNAYPMAAANDVKSAQRVKRRLCEFVTQTADTSDQAFVHMYNQLLKDLQHDLSPLDASPIVSLAAEEIEARRLGASSSAAQRGSRVSADDLPALQAYVERSATPPRTLPSPRQPQEQEQPDAE